MKHSASSQAGFLSIRLFILLLPLVLLWMGGQGLYTVLTNRHPLSMTFAEYAQKRPAGKWVELKGARLDITGATWFGVLSPVSDLYIPLLAADAPRDSKVCALLVTNDSAAIALVGEMKEITDEKAALAFMLKNQERLRPVRDVSGVLQFGVDSSDKKRRKIAKLNQDLTADFVVIEDGKRPGILSALGLLAAGFVAAWLCWFRRSGGSAATTVPPPLPQ